MSGALEDIIVLADGVSAEDIRAVLVAAVNTSWKIGGNDGRCDVPANFVGWILQEESSLRAENERLRKAIEQNKNGKCETVRPGV